MEDELKEYGLTDKEIKIYLTSLKIGESTTNKISQISKISRTTIYDIFENLKNKGLAYSFKKEKKIYFGVVNPEKLINNLEQKKDLIQNILPQLNQIKNQNYNKPIIEMYEGKTGIIQASFEMLKEKEILGFGSNQKIDKIFDMYQTNFSKRRQENKIKLKAIIEDEIPKHMLDKEILKYTKIKQFKTKNPGKTAQFIYADCVLIIIFNQDPIAISIKNLDYANSQREVFNKLWKIAKEI